jgi:ubiquitin carboxyl-terminal hydrolase 25
MIYANTDCIRPETKLAALALAKTDVVTNNPIQDDVDHTGLGEIGGFAVAGPMLPPTAADRPDSVMGDDPPSKDDVSSTVAEVDADNDHAMSELAPLSSEQPDTANRPEPPSRPPPVPPRPQDMKKIEGLAEQQDAAEILNNVFDLLSCAFKGSGTLRDGEQDDFVKKLFFSDVTSVRVTNGKTAHNSALQDNHLVSPGNRDRPLYAALDDEFSLTELEGETSQENQAKTLKFEYIATASPIQIVNVRRLVFEGGKSKKDESHLGLDEVLYLDRYLEQTRSLSKEDLQALRERQWQLQRKLKFLESRKKELQETELKTTLPDAVDETAAMIEEMHKRAEESLIDMDDDPIPTYPGLHEQLRERSHALRKETDILDGQMKELDLQIASIFEDCRDHPYRLHAVFMHRGSAGGGHYWIYIYDFQNNIWRDYNDERVEEAEVRKVFEQDGKATSTGVVFIDAARVDELTEAVCRQPEPSPETSNEVKEVEMEDIESVPISNFQVIDGVEKQ